MIKSGLAKNIIFGLIFSIIFGFMGNYLYKKLKLKDNIVSLNKYYVIEIAKNKNLNKFRNIGIFNHNNFISNSFFSSLGYNLLIFRKKNNIKACQSISAVSSDLSILIETGSYAENNDELVTSCLTEIISKSFKRFKEKIIVEVEDSILSKQFILKRLKSELLEREKRNSKREKNIGQLKRKRKTLELEKKERDNELRKEKKMSSTLYELEKSICDNVDTLLSNASTNVSIYSMDEIYFSLPFEKITYLNHLISLSKKCNRDIQPLKLDNNRNIRTLKLDNDIIKSELEILNLDNDLAGLKEVYSQINADIASQISEAEINEINNQINEIQKFISSSKLENIFHLQKNTVKVKEAIKKELYLTRTQTLITFSVLGFIVGFILGSNFLAVLKENK